VFGHKLSKTHCLLPGDIIVQYWLILGKSDFFVIWICRTRRTENPEDPEWVQGQYNYRRCTDWK